MTTTFKLKKIINKALLDIQQLLESNCINKQKDIDSIVIATIESIRKIPNKYTDTFIADFITRTKKLLSSTEYLVNIKDINV